MKIFSTDNTIFKYYEDKGTVTIYDKEQDTELSINTVDLIKFTDFLKPKDDVDERIKVGDIVKHFKRETATNEEKSTNMYLYKVLSFGVDSETGERTVIYMALYGNFKIYNRPYDMFMSKVDTVKYPNVKQEYRFQVYDFID